MSNATYRVFVEKLGASNPEEFIGDEGDLFYDPTGNVLRLSDGQTPGGIVLGGGGGSGWVRPADWLSMPTVENTEQKFVGLFAVHNAPENFIALHFEGDYVVDWGDGTVENITGGTKAQHSYTWADIPSSTLTTEGYRQVLVTVTPQSGQDLTIMDLTVRHDNITNPSSPCNSPWLDIIVSMPQASSGGPLRFCGVAYGLNSNGYLFNVQRIKIVHAGAMDDFYDCFYKFDGLRKVEILHSLPANTSFYSIFSDCTSLTDVVLSDTSLVVDMQTMFYNCYSLIIVPLFDTSSVTNMDEMFAQCSSLKTVPLFDTSSVTAMYGMFSGCSELTTVPLFDTSSVTNMFGFFSYCPSLISAPEFNTSSVTNSTDLFLNCPNLQSAAFSGTAVDIDYSNCLLGRDAIVAIFNGLATVSGKTINISGNYGVTDLISADYDIATNKGWTVTN